MKFSQVAQDAIVIAEQGFAMYHLMHNHILASIEDFLIVSCLGKGLYISLLNHLGKYIYDQIHRLQHYKLCYLYKHLIQP